MKPVISELTTNAYAKINLSLDILGTRPDGYHEVCMIMQSLVLHDTLTLRITGNSGVSMTCSDPSLPTGEKNLAYRAAALFCNTYGISDGISIHLDKVIPVAAGLAGGGACCGALLLASVCGAVLCCCAVVVAGAVSIAVAALGAS